MSDSRRALLMCVRDSISGRYGDLLDLSVEEIDQIAQGVAEDVWSQFDVKAWAARRNRRRSKNGKRTSRRRR